MLKQFETVRTTITIPKELINRSQQFIDSGDIPNRNTLVVVALEQYLQELERREIDRQFEAMAEDDAYQSLNEDVAASFVESDWEALEIGEQK